MGTIENIFSQAIVQKLGWTLVHFIWQGFAAAIVLAIVLRLLKGRSANLRYLIACGGLVLIVAMPVVTMQMIKVADIGLVPMPSKIEVDVPKAVPVVNVKAVELPPQPEVVAVTPRVPLKDRIVNVFEPALPYIVFGWLVGVFGFSLWHLGGWTQLQRMRRRMVKDVTPAIKRKVQRFAGVLGIKRAVGIMESALVEVPTVIGWLKPVILLPASAVTGLTFEQIEAILAHELAHIKRHDYLVNILQTFVEILGFYHPAVWWVSQRIRIERENCCDDMAVSVCGDKICYARALTSLEEMRGGYSLAVAASGGSLFDRIRRLVGKNNGNEGKLSWLPSVVAILLIAALLISTALALSNDESKQTDVKNDKVGVYQVNRSVLDFPGTEDFSTPEAAYAAINRTSVLGDPEGWKRVSVKRLAETLAAENRQGKMKADPEWSSVLLNAKILEVRVCGNQAAVMAELPQKFTSEKIRNPIDIRHLEQEDGKWLNAGNDRADNVSEAAIIFNRVIGREEPEVEIEQKADRNERSRLQKLVEDFFKHNYRDITARRTIEWGEPAVDAEGNMSIRYKYEATIWNKDKIIEDKVWTFDKQGKFISVRKVGAEDIYSLAGAKALVEDFFANNYRDITSRKTIEWGQPVKQENGNVSIRYKYEATIWDKDKIIQNKEFTFDKDGKFVKVSDITSSKADDNQQSQPPITKKVTLSYSVWMSDIGVNDVIKILDLASGEIVEVSGLATDGEFIRKVDTMPKGDVYVSYKKDINKPMLTFLKSAILGGESSSDKYKSISPIPMKIPWETTIATRQGYKYQFSLLSFDENECVIEYKPLNRAAEKAMEKAVFEKSTNMSGESNDKFTAGQGGNSNFESKEGFKATLANGVTVELVGVCDYPRDGGQCWSADGMSLGKAIPEHKTMNVLPLTGNRGIEVVLKYTNAFARDVGFKWELSDGLGDGTWVIDTKEKDLRGIIFQVQGINKTDISMGFAAGQWENAVRHLGIGGGGLNSSDGTSVIFHEAFQKDGKTYIDVSYGRDDVDVRLVAVGKSGKINSNMDLSGGGEKFLSFRFVFDLPIKEIESFVLQTRPYKWFTFKNVSLRPDFKTDVQVEVEKSAGQGEGVKNINNNNVEKNKLSPERFAIDLNGADDYLEIPSSKSLSLIPPFTIQMWVKPEFSPTSSPDTDRNLFCKGNFIAGSPDEKGKKKADAYGFGLSLRPENDSKIALDICTANGSINSHINLFQSTSDWMYIAVVLDDEKGRVYPGMLFDNSPKFYKPATEESIIIGGKFIIPTGNNFKGQISEIRIWNKALTNQEIQQLKNKTLTGNEPNLAGCWTFEKIEGNIIKDISPNGNHAYFRSKASSDKYEPNLSKITSVNSNLKSKPAGQVKKDKIEVQANYLSFPVDDNEITGFLKEIKKQSKGGEGVNEPNAAQTAFILNDEQAIKLLKLINVNPSAKSVAVPIVTVLDGEKASFRQVKKIMYTNPNSENGDVNELKVGIVMEVMPKLQEDGKILIDLNFTDTRLLEFRKYENVRLPITEIDNISSRLCMLSGSTILFVSNRPVKEKDDNGRPVEKNRVLLIKARKIDHRAS